PPIFTPFPYTTLFRSVATLEVQPSEAHLATDPMMGRRLGAYQIVKKIGHGGMAAVFLATRADDVYRKQVAIKLVMPGLDHQEILDRKSTRLNSSHQIN